MSSTAMRGRMVQKSTFQTAWSSQTLEAMSTAPRTTRFQLEACSARCVYAMRRFTYTSATIAHSGLSAAAVNSLCKSA
jgi:hypothetical protein